MYSVLRVYTRSQLDALSLHIKELNASLVYETRYGDVMPDLSHEAFLRELSSDWQVSVAFIHLCARWVKDFSQQKFVLNHSLNEVFNSFLFSEPDGPRVPYIDIELASTDMDELKRIFFSEDTAQKLNQNQLQDWWLYFLLAGMSVSNRRARLEHPALKYLTKNNEYCYGYLNRSQVAALLPPTHPDSFVGFIKTMIEKHCAEPQFWLPALDEWETTLGTIKSLPEQELYLLDFES